MKSERRAAEGEGRGQGEVVRLRADMAALADALRPLAGGRLDPLWAEIDGLSDATIARAMGAARGIRQMGAVPEDEGRQHGRWLAGLFAAFGLGLFAGIVLGRHRK
ncbi:MAG: hypothetical protein F9K34_16775 [Albidovulum sp.]|uniref:hypothetical protein n=1 Tax=Albidovulum sp. TaxID=1872424 RepID=UPI0013207781|nr:hypothetical protein [Defluviimonas sp.]KAB2880471.1 MAG: hypothetical protein F9K34_16775 [Defluviimonas sp.]